MRDYAKPAARKIVPSQRSGATRRDRQLDSLRTAADAGAAVGHLAAIQRTADRSHSAGGPVAQLKLYAGAGGVAVTADAKSAAQRARQGKFNPGGKNHLPNLTAPQAHHSGYKLGSKEYVGGVVFNNNPMPDGARLPYINGQTYQEWDVNWVKNGAVNQPRDAERVVTASDGQSYYTSDHYSNFTLIK